MKEEKGNGDKRSEGGHSGGERRRKKSEVLQQTAVNSDPCYSRLPPQCPTWPCLPIVEKEVTHVALCGAVAVACTVVIVQCPSATERDFVSLSPSPSAAVNGRAAGALRLPPPAALVGVPSQHYGAVHRDDEPGTGW